MLNSINKKMLLIVGCVVSGMIVASEKTALKENLVPALVAQQLCDNPGKHEVDILNELPGYKVIADNGFPMMLPSTGTVNAIIVLKGERNIGWDHSQEPIHQAALTKSGDLTVTLCDGQKNTSNIFDTKKSTVTIQ